MCFGGGDAGVTPPDRLSSATRSTHAAARRTPGLPPVRRRRTRGVACSCSSRSQSAGIDPNRRARLSRTRRSACACRISIPDCPQLHACRRPCLRPPNHCSGSSQHEIAAVALSGVGSSTPQTETAVARPAGLRPAIDPLRVPPQKNAQSEALGCSPAGRGTTWVDRGGSRAAVARARTIPRCDPSPVVGRYTERSRRSSEI